MSPSGLLADLPCLGLDELNERAGLLTRVDRKYVLSTAELPAALNLLPPDARILDIDGQRDPVYESTYLDTPELAAFHAVAHRRRRRWKVRTRTYSSTDTSFLEVKTRRHAATVKQRTPWPDTPTLGREGGDFVVAVLEGAGIPLEASRLRPVLDTRYRRTTVLLPTEGARVTIDTDLTWLDAEIPGSVVPGRASWSDRVVLETKTTGSPSCLDRALWSLGHRPQAMSKYAIGMAMLHPDLPRNRWHRLLGPTPNSATPSTRRTTS